MQKYLSEKGINDSLLDNSQHFFFDGYDIDNIVLSDIKYVNNFINEVNEIVNVGVTKIILIPYFNGKVEEDGGISAVIIGDNFHFTCHTFSFKNTIFIDCYGQKKIDEQLLDIITKYFRTDNFDLCKSNNDKEGNFGKHIIINIKKLIDYNNAKDLINNIVKEVDMTPISDVQINYRDNANYDILQPIAESHISIHRTENSCVIDIFSCKCFNENKILKMLDGDFENIIQIQRGIYYK